MAEYTKNYNLKKLGQEEFYNIEDFNNNTDIIDTELKKANDKAGGAGEKVAALQDEFVAHKAKIATQDTLGHVKAGTNITIDVDGTINAKGGDVDSVNGKTGEVKLVANDVGAVPTTRKINSKALSSDITLDGKDVAPITKLALYCDASAGNDNNDGLAKGTAVKTFAKAVSIAEKTIANEVKITLMPGTYAPANIYNILAPAIYIQGDYKNAMTTIIDGRLDLDYMQGKSVHLINFTLNGGVNVTNGGLSHFDAYNIYLQEQIKLSDIATASIKSCTYLNPAGVGCMIENAGSVYIYHNTMNVKHFAMNLVNCGVVAIESNTINLSSPTDAMGAIKLTNCMGKAYSNKGSTGVAPKFQVVSSILFRNSNSDLSGATEVKKDGGIIYTY